MAKENPLLDLNSQIVSLDKLNQNSIENISNSLTNIEVKDKIPQKEENKISTLNNSFEGLQNIEVALRRF